MSERMTAISLPGVWNAGVADWGRKSVPEMIALLRSHAATMRATADAILAAGDDDFRVETYVGPHAQRDRTILQVGINPGAHR